MPDTETKFNLKLNKKELTLLMQIFRTKGLMLEPDSWDTGASLLKKMKALETTNGKATENAS